jgi:hypothetical protein
MGKGIAHCGRIIVAAIPRIFDTARAVSIIGKDGTSSIANVNQINITPEGPQMIDLAKGKFNVEVEVGPNYATRMQAAGDGMMQFVSSIPNAAMGVADLVAKAQDWPNADQFAERLKKMLPPGIADDAQQQPDPAQMQAMQMQQQQQQQAAIHAEEMMKLEYRTQLAKAAEAEAQAQEAQARATQAQTEARAAGMMPAPVQN